MIWFALTGVVVGATYRKGKTFLNKVDKGALTFNEDAPYYQERIEAYSRAIGSLNKGDSKGGSSEEHGDLHIDYSNLDGLAKAIAKAADSAFEQLSAKIKRGEYK